MTYLIDGGGGHYVHVSEETFKNELDKAIKRDCPTVLGICHNGLMIHMYVPKDRWYFKLLGNSQVRGWFIKPRTTNI
jgi:hypothetical protein